MTIELHQLPDWIDWDKVMTKERYASGHEDVMRSIFRNPVKVIAEWVEDDYQGEEAFAYQFPDGSIVLITDYFGSCSGCDSWEGASDNEARAMIESLVHSARIKPSIDAALVFCNEEALNDASEYPFKACNNLVDQLRKLVN